METIDLHIHTTYSDGTHSVSEVLEMAEALREKLDLQVISITDHDSVGAYQELKSKEIRNLYQGKIIGGVELSFNLNNRLYDLLGYGINIGKMLELLNIRADEKKRIERENSILSEFLAVCDKKGIEHRQDLKVTAGNVHEAFNVVWEDITNFTEHPQNARFKEYSIEKPSINIFHKTHFLNPDSEFFVNVAAYSPSLKEAIKMIHDCGGKTFLAHSFVYGLSDVAAFIEYAIGEGIDGLEKYYSAHTKEQEEVIQDYADRYGLFVSGGSDFHGEKPKPGVKIGTGKGDMRVTRDIIKTWEQENGAN